MRTRYSYLANILFTFVILLSVISCKKASELRRDPEIEPLKEGFRVSAAVGYCASLANTLFRGEPLPANVIYRSVNNSEYTGSGLMYVTINEQWPLPFNRTVGQIIIACLWNAGMNGQDYDGVITAVFTDIDILNDKYNFVGIRTVPVMQDENGNILTLFAEQDIIIGKGSDTLLNLSLSNPAFHSEISRLDETPPLDVFAAVKQNVWFINVNQNQTFNNVYDDEYTINGGGQLALASGTDGGIIYHAMIGVKFNPSGCDLNPLEGVGFIQDIRAGSSIDLGNIFLSFHDNCDGKARVEFSSGKYLTAIHRNVNLNFY